MWDAPLPAFVPNCDDYQRIRKKSAIACEGEISQARVPDFGVYAPHHRVKRVHTLTLQRVQNGKKLLDGA
jgi:hypothetical protein